MKFIYTGNSKSSGIYKIFNAHTNRTYVGQAKSFQQRWYDHRQRPELKEAFKVNCPSKMAVAKSIEARKKLYGKVRSPTGEVYEVWSLSGFCREHGLGAHSHSNLGRLLTGKYTQLLGWTRVLDE